MTAPAEPNLFGVDLSAPAATFPRYVCVALNRPVRTEFTYGVPEGLDPAPAAGSRVVVPFGSRREVGVVVGVDGEPPEGARRIRALERVLDPEPLVDGELLELTRWMAERWASSWGEALAALLPATLRSERRERTVLAARAAPGVGEAELAQLAERFPKQHRLLRTLLDAGHPVELRELTRRLNVTESPARTLAKRGWIALEKVAATPGQLAGADGGADRRRPETLTPAQEAALGAIGLALDLRCHRTFLVQGVTGSGKTEVYLRAIERARAADRGAIVLVPEISLTPQTVGWFRSRFGEVAVLHSRMTDAQRHDMWMRVRRGEARVVVGARSAIFAPVRDLGVVVVDEEHEPSFKQQNAPRYHARDLAVERARRAGAVCLLGSATPSLESWHAAREGRMKRLLLPARVKGARLPDVEIVDMRSEVDARGRPRLFSRRLELLLTETLERGEQSILFLNRRGHTRVLYCPACKTPVRCSQCAASLTYHRRIDRVVCHLCCEEHAPPRACPTCTAPALLPFGAGVEQTEAAVRALLPAARVKRMDSDTMLRFEDYAEALSAFGRREIDVLVGTQMIAKGLDFPGVTLVGIVHADTALHLADFRAAERTHQLVSQVAGRAGRGELAGRIVVQSLLPTEPAIVHAAHHDFDAFARTECAERLDIGYPPFGRVLRALFEGADLAAVTAAAEEGARRAAEALRGHAAQVLPASPAPFSLVRGRHRHHLLVKAADDAAVVRARDALVEVQEAAPRDVRATVDVDPASLL